MAELTHVLAWNEAAQIYTCRTGFCNWAKTRDEVEAAGYQARAAGNIFVKEKDFLQVNDEEV